MFQIQQVDHVVLRVKNMANMRRFYCEVLGCTLEKIQAHVGLVHLRAGRTLIDLVDVNGKIGRRGGPAPDETGHNMDHLCLRITPFDESALLAYLCAHGVDPGDVTDGYGAEGNGPNIYFTDPEGNGVELKGPPYTDAKNSDHSYPG